MARVNTGPLTRALVVEDPDPIVVADAPAFGPDAPDPVRNGELADNRQACSAASSLPVLWFRPETDCGFARRWRTAAGLTASGCCSLANRLAPWSRFA